MQLLRRPLEAWRPPGAAAQRPYLDAIFTLRLRFEAKVVKEDGHVLRLLMTHVCQATGLQLQETDYSQTPAAGEYIHLASQDADAPAGRLRVLLNSAEFC